VVPEPSDCWLSDATPSRNPPPPPGHHRDQRHCSLNPCPQKRLLPSKSARALSNSWAFQRKHFLRAEIAGEIAVFARRQMGRLILVRAACGGANGELRDSNVGPAASGGSNQRSSGNPSLRSGLPPLGRIFSQASLPENPSRGSAQLPVGQYEGRVTEWMKSIPSMLRKMKK
jgi:hypothetical protein